MAAAAMGELMGHSLMEGARNFRDVGGHPTKDGHRVRRGLVYRSDRLASLTDGDMRTFARLGIRTVVDFRPQAEKEMTGHNRMPAGVTYRTFEIGDAAMAPQVRRALEEGDFTALPDLEEGNRRLVRDFAGELGAAIRLMADGDNLPLVFHCIGGKDRTGMTAMLLLSILGVPAERVRADYLRSNDALGASPEAQEAFLRRFLGGEPGDALSEENRSALRRFFILEDSYFDAAWDEIGLIAGSLDQYVRSHLGLTERHVAALRELLLESP